MTKILLQVNNLFLFNIWLGNFKC